MLTPPRPILYIYPLLDTISPLADATLGLSSLPLAAQASHAILQGADPTKDGRQQQQVGTAPRSRSDAVEESQKYRQFSAESADSTGPQFF